MNVKRISIVCWLLLVAGDPIAAQTLTQDEAGRMLRKVVSFHRQEVGYEGAYLWRYAADLSAQEGEGTATKTSGWTQPPGTPSVGEAYLKAWRLTQDKACLEAAVEAAHALVRSQLESGGWSSHFELAGQGRRRYRYRTDGEQAGKNNNTTFDDNKTQSALMLSMHVDEALQFRNEQIHEAVEYGLKRILAAQYPNGAWPQQYSEPPDASKHPVKQASFPDTWPRTFPGQRYTAHYTLNDNNMSYIVDMLTEAHRIYGRKDCHEAAKRTGEFFLLAQLPDPQPGWAQQYNSEMHPVWARKFEPPAVTGGESQSVMRTLLKVYQHTGNKKFLEPIPIALDYYRRSLLPDGRLARFYELQTNRPLFFTKEYELTYSADDVPTHYAFKVGSRLDSIEAAYDRILNTPADKLKPEHHHDSPVKLTSKLQKQAAAVVSALDDRGAWVESGHMRHQEQRLNVIEMRTLIRNLEILARYAGAKKKID